MKFTKKGQGLPLNVIILAIIVLLVLVVIWVIFTGRAGTFSEKATKAQDNVDGIDVDDTGALTGLPTDILGGFMPLIPIFRRRKRLF